MTAETESEISRGLAKQRELALRIAVGSRIRQEREARGLTKEALGQAAGLQAKYLWRLEDGRQNATLATLTAIAGALGITMSALFTGVEKLIKHPIEWPAPRPRGRKAREAAQES